MHHQGASPQLPARRFGLSARPKPALGAPPRRRRCAAARRARLNCGQHRGGSRKPDSETGYGTGRERRPKSALSRGCYLHWPYSSVHAPCNLLCVPSPMVVIGDALPMAHAGWWLERAQPAPRARAERRSGSAPRGKHLFYSLQVCRLPPPAPLARRWAPAPSPRGCTPPSAPPRPVSRAEAPPGTPYRPPKQHIPFC